MPDRRPTPASAMAASARDKFQASARELMKSLEEAIQARRPASESALKDGATAMEQALRTMFSSCTSGADGNVQKQEEQVLVTATSSSSSRSTKSSSQAGTNKESIKPVATPVKQKDIGEHIYAQLFFDDQIRAAKAISALREQPPPSTPSGKPSHNPFPVSSPLHRADPVLGPPLAETELDISRSLTFDDSISAISAHTLEAMAQTNHAAAHRGPHAPVKASPPRPETLGASKSPFDGDLVRVRSNNTYSSKLTKTSSSTRTTESGSFDNWQKEEKRYWVSQADKEEQQEKQRRRSLRLVSLVEPLLGSLSSIDN